MIIIFAVFKIIKYEEEGSEAADRSKTVRRSHTEIREQHRLRLDHDRQSDCRVRRRHWQVCKTSKQIKTQGTNLISLSRNKNGPIFLSWDSIKMHAKSTIRIMTLKRSSKSNQRLYMKKILNLKVIKMVNKIN